MINNIIYTTNIAESIDKLLQGKEYDKLFISYDNEIVPTISPNGYEWYEGYKFILDGPTMVDFIDAAEKYSNYDVSKIRKELEKKKAWYYERNPKNKR